MVGAADAFVVNPAVGQRRQPMPALLGHQAVARLRLAGSAGEAEYHQLLAQQLDGLDRLFVGQLARHRHRMPVATQQLAGGCARANAREYLVLVLPHDDLTTAFGPCSTVIKGPD